MPEGIGWRSFGTARQGKDGVTYNLPFDRYDDALHAWRYPDLTHHVSFLADALDRTEYPILERPRLWKMLCVRFARSFLGR